MNRKKPFTLKSFEQQVKAAGGEVLGPTNPYEVLRFKTSYGVGVVYQGRRGETWNAEAIAARNHIANGKGSLSPVLVKGRRSNKASVKAIISRDGDCCLFCGNPLLTDITVEHLVPISHGGPNHISNLFLAHSDCNKQVGHMSAPEKVKYAIERRSL